MLRWKKMDNAGIASSLRQALDILKPVAESDFSASGLENAFLGAIGTGDKGILLWPLRVALSGRTASPGPFEIMAVLGKAEVMRRVEAAIEKVSKS